MLGGTRITYLGHATFSAVTPGAERIIIDPFLTDNPTTPEEHKEVGDLDTILITHGHFDHFADAIPLAQETGATVISNFEIMSYLQSKGVENPQPIKKGGTAQVGGIRVTATHAFHSSSIQTEDGSLIYGGEPMGYILEFESGFKLYHAGDTAVFGDMQLIGQIYRPDVALLPIGDRLVMGPLEAADRKSTRLNSSHANISYAVFCLKKKKKLNMKCKQLITTSSIIQNKMKMNMY